MLQPLRHGWAACISAIALVVAMAACSPEQASYSDLRPLPHDTWQHNLVIDCTPVYGDSTATYDIMFVMRHTVDLAVAQLPVTVDLIAADSTIVRRQLCITLADQYGHWTGSGFGTLYQHRDTIATGVTPAQATHVVLWLSADSIPGIAGITEAGIIVTPTPRK